MREMAWNEDLAQLSQTVANKCHIAHSPQSFRENKFGFDYIGENFSVYSGSMSIGASDAAESWWYERNDYTLETHECAPGKACGHYTQVDESQYLKIKLIQA